MNLDEDILAAASMRQHPFVPAYLNNIETIRQKKEILEKAKSG